MSRSNGSIIGTISILSSAGASGIWTLSNQQQQRNINNWPGQPVEPVEYLVVAGGGGGANRGAGGGGGGGGELAIGRTGAIGR